MAIIPVCVHMGIFHFNRLEDQRCTSAKLFLQFHSTIVVDCCYILRGAAEFWNESLFMFYGNVFHTTPALETAWLHWVGDTGLKATYCNMFNIFTSFVAVQSQYRYYDMFLKGSNWLSMKVPLFLDVAEISEQIGKPRLCNVPGWVLVLFIFITGIAMYKWST